jgi:4-amino-4-deoxy-L-arabinose transferase-like glycosyltransferase
VFCAEIQSRAEDLARLETAILNGDRTEKRQRLRNEAIVVLFALAVYLGSIISPPPLMDDVDSAHAQIARSMLESGDWVSARLDGVLYLDKAPLHFWAIALSYSLFGVHDWAARIPLALSAVLLCWLAARIAAWAFSARAGLYAGLALASCVGLFLFTRVLIPDAIVTLSVTLALWSMLRSLDEKEERPRLWAFLLAVSVGVGLLAKGLLGVVVTFGSGTIYLLFTKQLFVRRTWQRLHPFTGAAVILLIAAPWHVLATLRNPPFLDFTIHSGPQDYRGFFWRYFINEHLLRYLNLRYPRDYDTVPRAAFWLLNLLWLFPWTAFLPSVIRLNYRPFDRAGRLRLLALCWIAFVLIFFTFSTTQEYYSMPAYPAMALLLASGILARGPGSGRKMIAGICGLAVAVIAVLLLASWGIPSPGDISKALSSNPSDYTLSLGHVNDLTLRAFAYLRIPLAIAGAALLIGLLGTLLLQGRWTYFALAGMMALFFQAARIAMIAFDPVLSSRPLASVIQTAAPGRLILNDEYYSFSSVLFYTNQPAFILHGRFNNLEYGSYAPGAPAVFLDDGAFREQWLGSERFYLLTLPSGIPGLEKLVGTDNLRAVAESGGKYLLTNR